MNDSDSPVRYVDIRCRARDAVGDELGSGDWSVGPIEPRATTLTSVPIPLAYDDLDTVQCGLIAAHPSAPDA